MYFIIGIFFAYLYYKIRKEKNVILKGLTEIFIWAYLMLIILFALDYYNIPTLFGYSLNVDSKSWLDILANFILTLMSTLITCFITIHITLKQIEQTKQDNNELNDKNVRIQNCPLLEYSCDSLNDNEFSPDKVLKPIILNNPNPTKNPTSIYLKIKNIGLNSAKKIWFCISCEKLDAKKIIKTQKCISVNNLTYLEITFDMLDNEELKFKVSVYYEDLVNNWYVQEIVLSIINTNFLDSRSTKIYNREIINIYEEKLIEYDEIVDIFNKNGE